MHALTNSSQVGVNRRPNPNAAHSEALADGKLQVQQWDPLQDKQDKKRDHKSPWGHTNLRSDNWRHRRNVCEHIDTPYTIGILYVCITMRVVPGQG